MNIPMTDPLADFKSGALVRIGDSKDGQSYVVAHVRRFPHGYMVGIYDEPPGDHVDYWNPTSLSVVV